MSRSRRNWTHPRIDRAAANKRAPIQTCPCGKFGYASRKDAKRTMKTIPPTTDGRGHLDTYRCPLTDSGLWHLGHLPPTVVRGKASREEIVVAPREPLARRTPGRRR